MTEIKQPTDRKPKVKAFTFTDQAGKPHTLPNAAKGADKVPGKITRDAIMETEDETAQMRLGFALLEACGASEAALNAVYEKPSTEMIELLGRWMQHGDGDGASVPQS